MIHLTKSSNFIQFLSFCFEVCTQYYSPILYEDITSKDLRMLFGNSFRGITSGFLGYKSLALEPCFQRVMPHVQTHSAKYPRDVSAATVTCSLKCCTSHPSYSKVVWVSFAVDKFGNVVQKSKKVRKQMITHGVKYMC